MRSNSSGFSAPVRGGRAAQKLFIEVPRHLEKGAEIR
jgi:hypothetical protein